MIDIDLLNTYFSDEIDSNKAAANYDRLRLWFSTNVSSEIDTRPGSVFGDMVINPAARIITANNTAITNFCSDLDLANVAQGKIYNCEFVAEYLKNFSASNYSTVTSSGIIRLVFSDTSYREIDRSVQFKIGDLIFLPRLYKDTSISVLSPGVARRPEFNDFSLTGLSDRFYIDIAVYSMDQAVVTNLSNFAISEEIPGLVEIYAVGDFWSTPVDTSLPELARKTREKVVSSNSTNRSGIAKLAKQEFPELTAVSPVLTGDFEMVRQNFNPLGMSVPKIDLYVRSPLYGTEFKQPVRLNLDEDSEYYFGEIKLAETPIKFGDLSFANNTLNGIEYTSYVMSSDDSLPGVSCAGTDKQRFFLKVPVPKTDTGIPIVPPLIDTDNDKFYQVFEITYNADPGVNPVREFFSSPDTKPIGVDVFVKSFVPIDFSGLFIHYSRKRGTKINQTKVSDEVFSYLSTVSWPEVYSDANIIDSMFYAGASNVIKIESDAKIRVSPAERLLTTVPTTVDEADEFSVEIPTIFVGNSNGFMTKAKDDTVEFSENLHYATGYRNLTFLLDKTKIFFRESGNDVH